MANPPSWAATSAVATLWAGTGRDGESGTGTPGRKLPASSIPRSTPGGEANFTEPDVPGSTGQLPQPLPGWGDPCTGLGSPDGEKIANPGTN